MWTAGRCLVLKCRSSGWKDRPVSSLWTPKPERIANSNQRQFEEFLARRGIGPFADYDALHRWSVADQGAFYDAVWDFFGVVGLKGDIAFLPPITDDIRSARYFPEARLSYAENLLRWAEDPAFADQPALLFDREDGLHIAMSWHELRDLTARFQAFMVAHDVGEKDRVAALVPNCPEAIAILLAANSLGAITSTASPDFGVSGAVDRFGQIEPKVFFSVDGYLYGGRRFEISEKANDIAAQLPGLRAHKMLRFLDYDDRQDLPPPALPLRFKALRFDHPLYILFSSGTTGKPKCLVHRQGGPLLKHLVEHAINGDNKPGDVTFFFSTCGWMMWNWLVTGLANRQTLQLYDGSPFQPGPEALWNMAAKNNWSQFGCGAKYVDAIAKSGYRPKNHHTFPKLRNIATTGSTLIEESFDFIYDAVKADVALTSVSGGTDLVGCLVGAVSTKPIYRGEIQGAILACDVQVLRSDGSEAAIGERGELACNGPFPTMPIAFWRDENDTKFNAAYFETYPGIWHHGDFIERTAAGGYIIHGRSDATLNPGGVRIGTAEIYRQVETMEEIAEAVVVSQEHCGDSRIVLFLKMTPGFSLTDDLATKLKSRIRKGASPRHVPSVIAAVADLPRTRSGKITEIAVRDILAGRGVQNEGALANPEALALFIPALAAAEA